MRTLPYISPYPPAFQLGICITSERMEELGLWKNRFLWPEEKQLVTQVLLLNEKGLAWEKTEKERFRDDYFSPVKIPVQEHLLWA